MSNEPAIAGSLMQNTFEIGTDRFLVFASLKFAAAPLR